MQVKGKIDILMISETKVDENIPTGNFLIERFGTPYRLGRDSLRDHGICKRKYTL